MKIFILNLDSAQANLAFEEWYHGNFEEDTLRLWINQEAVVLGKHQNALAESNYSYCLENNIPILRRITGGGTVYHDPGNINFSFFRQTSGLRIDYAENLKLILNALEKLGLKLRMNERHDLWFDNYKVSGNAQHIRQGKVLHHGTLLYDSNLIRLRKSIKREHGHFIDKSVQSVRSSVCNIRSLFDFGSSEEFCQQLFDSLIESSASIEKCNPPESKDLLPISKYLSDDWNLGYGPAYIFQNTKDGLKIEISVARGGEISAISCQIDERATDLSSLIGKLHRRQDLKNVLENNHLETRTKELILDALF